MKAKLIKQFGKLKPGIYDWPELLVKKLTALGFVEKEAPKVAPKVEVKPEVKVTPKRKKKEKVVYEDKSLKNVEDN